MRITVPGFSGVVRITAPQRLEDHQAQVATNCDFRSGDLRAYYGDKESTTYTGTFSAADPSSMFLYDQGALIVEPNDISFARSPVFFSDNLGNDKRVFYADNNDTGDYPKVIETFSGTGRIPASANRLGVPKPNAPAINRDGVDVIKFEDQSGPITRMVYCTKSVGDTNTLHDHQFNYKDGAPIKDGDSLLVVAPGVEPIPYTAKTVLVTSGGSTLPVPLQFSLRKSGAVWAKISAPLKLKRNNVDDKTIYFSKTNHGLFEGDQVVINYGNKTWRQSTTIRHGINRFVFYKVANATANEFSLEYLSGGTYVPLQHTSTTAIDDNVLWVARIASVDNAIADDATLGFSWAPATTGGLYENIVIAYTIPADVEATWSYASTIDVVADRSYCVTFVNSFGDESEPSLPTDTMTVVPGSPVTFNAKSIPTAATGLDKYKEPKEIRLYRTDALGTFRLVTTDSMDPDTTKTNRINFLTAKAINTAGTGVIFTDTFLDSELGEPLATAGWSVPSIGMHGLVNCPNGVVAGHRGRTIFGSVPYAPYAWPILNQVATDYDVVGLVPTSAGLVVVTKGMPAILIGDNPANWTMQKLEYPQGCVARRSIVDMGEFAMYASPDGLVAITGANVEILTKPILTREQWQAYNPSTITAAQVEGRYIATYVSGGSRKGFIYDPQTQSFTDLTLTSVAFCNDLLADVLLMLDKDGRIYEWNQNTAAFKPFTWHSKWFQLPIPELMGVAQIFTTTIDLTGRNLTFRLHGYDNNQAVMIYEISTSTSPDAILGNRPFRLPYVAPGRFTAFKITLEGSIPVGTVMVGRTMDEMKLAP